MTRSSRQHQSIDELNSLRRQAVELRLGGATLAETQASVGLTAPTVIAAMKAYKEGGWQAVDVGERGRPQISSRARTSKQLCKTLFDDTLLSASQDAGNATWDIEKVQQWMLTQEIDVSRSTVLNWLHKWDLLPASRYTHLRNLAKQHASNSGWIEQHQTFARRARRKNTSVYWISSREIHQDYYQLFAHDLRGHAVWMAAKGKPSSQHYLHFFQSLNRKTDGSVALVLSNAYLKKHQSIESWLDETNTETLVIGDPTVSNNAMNASIEIMSPPKETSSTGTLTHLQRLEAESIQIMREVVADADNPVMMYSVGKDSAVMLHLARKAFYPATPPFPLLHVDTGWKFKAMYEFRDAITKEYGMELITHINPEGLQQKVNPFTHGSSLHTDIMKTQGLKQALDKYGFDFAFGGARRDEEKSRAKERIFSFRNAQHSWDVKNQRPELWQIYNARKQKGESIRVFPLSNWTELDIWLYIHMEDIPIVPLYLAAERPVVNRDGSLIMVDDDRMPLNDGEVPEMRSVRFRTLGCYPLTGAVDSTANTLEDIIQEMLVTRSSERQGRMIDHDSAASMEKKKQEGYF